MKTFRWAVGLSSVVFVATALACGSEPPEGAGDEGGGAGADRDATAGPAPSSDAAVAPPLADGGPNGGEAGGEEGPTEVDGGTCHSLADLGVEVTSRAVSAPLPTGQGGTIAPGRYVLRDFVYYGASKAGLAGSKLHETIYLTSAKQFIVATSPGYPPVQESRTYTAEGTYFYWFSYCPERHNSNPTYTATATTFQLVYRDVDPKTGYVETYEKM